MCDKTKNPMNRKGVGLNSKPNTKDTAEHQQASSTKQTSSKNEDSSQMEQWFNTYF